MWRQPHRHQTDDDRERAEQQRTGAGTRDITLAAVSEVDEQRLVGERRAHGGRAERDGSQVAARHHHAGGHHQPHLEQDGGALRHQRLLLARLGHDP